MYIDVLTGLVIGLCVLIAREMYTRKQRGEAQRAIAAYKERGRTITALTQEVAKLEEALDVANNIDKLVESSG